MPRSAKNKMKAWRRTSLGNHTGRKMKHIAMQNSVGGTGSTATELLTGLFSRAEIRMPKAEAFRDMLQRLVASKQAEAEADAIVEAKKADGQEPVGAPA